MKSKESRYTYRRGGIDTFGVLGFEESIEERSKHLFVLGGGSDEVGAVK